MPALLAIALLLGAPPEAGDWPQFLGPNRDGKAAASGLNLDWHQAPPPVLWKVPLGGGYSSAAMVGDRLFTMARQGPRDLVLCLDFTTGRELWRHDAAPTYDDVQHQGQGPRSTPTWDRGRLYCLLPAGELLCLGAADGKRLWQAHIFRDTKARERVGEYEFWGLAAAPLVVDDVVVVQSGGDQDNGVAAFHRDTGKVVWTAGSDPFTYASPILATLAGKRQIVCPTGKSVLGLDPATGRVLWRYPFGHSRFSALCATPVLHNDTLFVSAGYGVGGAAVAILDTGSALEVRERWKTRDIQNNFANSVIHEGRLYGCHGDNGPCFLRCLDFATGAVQWSQRVECRQSLVLVGDRLICLGERGTLRLLRATPTGYRVEAEMKDLLTYKAWPAPVLCRGRLLLRDEMHLLCLDLRARQ